MDFLDKLKLAGKSDITRYADFLRQYKINEKSLHLFIEGNDDPSFYTNFIAIIAGSDYKIYYYNSKNKDGVYKNHNRIRWEHYNKNRVLFFVDKDYSDILNIVYKNDENIFVTKYYSIENYLVNTEILERIIIELLHITDTSTLKSIKSHFNLQHEIFYQKMMIITSWIIYHRMINTNLPLKKINLSHIFSFNNKIELEKNNKPSNMKLLDYLDKKTNNEIKVSWKKIRIIYVDLVKINNNKKHLRGKFEIWFLTAYINNFIEKNNSKKGSSKIKMRINLTHTNAVTILGSKLSIPKELKYFIENNIHKLSPTKNIVNAG